MKVSVGSDNNSTDISHASITNNWQNWVVWGIVDKAIIFNMLSRSGRRSHYGVGGQVIMVWEVWLLRVGR